MIFCSALGAGIICISSNYLSKITFNSTDYTWGFLSLSVAIFFTILHSGNITVLQGTRHLRAMAKASVFGSLISLLFSVPFFFYFKENGIVLALIFSAVITFLSGWYFSYKSKFTHPHISIRTTIKDGAEMAKLGIAMMVATLIGSAVNYIINAYISHFGSVTDVGLYGAGMSITNQYVGLIFTAMSVDYFPRLSVACYNEAKVNELVNQQAEIVILIASPILIGMMLTAPILIKVLLSTQFLALTNFVCIMAFAMLFKAASFAMGYISFAKGDKKIFFLFEGVFNSSITLIFSIIGYRLGGITGVAISILLSNIVYIVNVNILTRRRYKFKLSLSLMKLFSVFFIIISIVLIAVLKFKNLYGYTLGTCLFLFSVIYSFNQLDNRINLKSFLISKFAK
ncbi:MAG: hypothetical protein JWQ25_2229 [Daejeonella sp.]|nr:hypothetical protein [Daejeonella sp.]